MSDSRPATRRRFRPRFSLLTVLLATTIIALALAVWQLWREVGPLRADVRRLRIEVGELSISDLTKIHAIQVDTGEPLIWKWRVWLPENRAYVFHIHGERIPKEGFPTDELDSTWIREPGEHVITYRITRDPRSGEWHGSMGTHTGSVGGDRHPWVEWSSRTSTGNGVARSTRVFEPDQRVELIRHRVSQAQDSTQIEDPAAGFMIWLEPAN